ncbi:MAG TPA: hypothetical protein VK009_07650 [Chloroflexota bacterium]|nr:hypothetical protein [Chloroflexota bacterium]
MVQLEVYRDHAGERVEMFARRYGRSTAYVVRQAGVPDRFLASPDAVKRARRELQELGFALEKTESEPCLAWRSRLAKLTLRLRLA